MKQQINPFVSRMLERSGYIVPKLQTTLDSAYNQGTKVDVEASKGAKITSAKANEKTGEFIAREQSGTVRKGKLNDPLRFIAWNQAVTRFYADQGEPSGEVTVAILPARLKEWLDSTHRTAGKSKGKATEKATKPGKLTMPARVTKPATATDEQAPQVVSNGNGAH